MTARNVDRFRFFITDEDDVRWSDVWFVEGGANSVYLASRKLGGSLKLSLHPRGQARDGCDCQFGHPRSYAELEIAAGNNPMPIVRWARPQIAEKHFVQVARVLFPTGYLGPLPKLETDGKLKIALPKAPVGQATEVSIFCSRGDPQRYEDKVTANGFTPFMYYTLGGDEYASLFARHVPFDVPVEKVIAKIASTPANPLIGAPASNQTISDARAIIVGGHPEKGEPLSLTELGPLRVTPSEEQSG